MSTPKIRVLVVDDSALMRKLVSDILSADPDIEVIGTARDGADGLDKVLSMSPDVVTLDVEMPVKDGFMTLGEIMSKKPTPVIMVSSLTQAGAEATLRCLKLGAVDFVGKPSGAISLDIRKVSEDLVQKVKIAFSAKRSLNHRPSTAIPPKIPISHTAPKFEGGGRILVIGSSTGGPRALHALAPNLPGNLGMPIVIIQHLPEAFTAMLAAKLNDECEYEVREVKEGDRLQPGLALVAAGGKHLKFDADGVAHFSMEPQIHGVRPAVDVTLGSLVQAFGSRVMGVILTGMGKDGALAMKALRDRGGLTIAEDESTCVVYGMPKAVVDLGAASHVLPLGQIARFICDGARIPANRAS